MLIGALLVLLFCSRYRFNLVAFGALLIAYFASFFAAPASR